MFAERMMCRMLSYQAVGVAGEAPTSGRRDQAQPSPAAVAVVKPTAAAQGSAVPHKKTGWGPGNWFATAHTVRACCSVHACM